MKLLIAATLALCSTGAAAQIVVQIGAPVVAFAAPPTLVMVSPGVQVVEDYGDEVFYIDNYYWMRSGTAWYRTTNYRGGWVVVQPQRVPTRIIHLPPGQYRHYHHASPSSHSVARHSNVATGG